MLVESINRSIDNPRDIRNREVVNPAANPFDANLATPINSSEFTRRFFSLLPAYRKGLSPIRRGFEVGIVHGYWLVGPFATLGPLRESKIPYLAGLLSTIGLIVISALSIFLYAYSNPPKPTTTITTPNYPNEFATPSGWNSYGNGFLVGGLIGAVLAYLLLSILGNAGLIP